jgi:hypothetical protein
MLQGKNPVENDPKLLSVAWAPRLLARFSKLSSVTIKAPMDL